MKILLTGGAGYIGSHTAVELINRNDEVIIVDNFSNSKPEVLNRIEKITNKRPISFDVDLNNFAKIDEILNNIKPDAVIHFAGLKAVGESIQKPLKYYENNLVSTINLLKAMQKNNIKNLIFSSSATVYGDPSENPLTENSRTGVGITNPYGWTKYFIEQILKDFAKTQADFNVTILRYFNPIGAHSSGLIGEDPSGIPNNLFPFIAQVAVGIREKVLIFGDDYDTPDGTCLRDYIHVVDLARGHLAAIDKMNGLKIYNLGSGKGFSVKEIISEFSLASGREIPYEIAPRREGDLPMLVANPNHANNELGWKVQKKLIDSCRDSWNWQINNPNGY